MRQSRMKIANCASMVALLLALGLGLAAPRAPAADSSPDGYGIYRKVCGGRTNLIEFFTASPNNHVEGLTLRTYNGVTHLWSVYWANSRDGILSSPQVGKFDHGQGEFYAQDNV